MARKFRNRAAESAIGSEPILDMDMPLYSLSDFDSSGELKSESSGSGNTRAAQSAINSAAGGGSGMDIASSALIASGNPYAMGAGAGLAVLGAKQKRENAEMDMKYKREQDRINRQQQALTRLIDISSGLRRL